MTTDRNYFVVRKPYGIPFVIDFETEAPTTAYFLTADVTAQEAQDFIVEWFSRQSLYNQRLTVDEFIADQGLTDDTD